MQHWLAAVLYQGGQGSDSQIFGVEHKGSIANSVIMQTMNGEELIRCVENESSECNGVHGHVAIPDFIQFASMDVEGQEAGLLSTWPWSRIKVAVFIIENAGNGSPQQKVRDIMHAQGYVKAAVTGQGLSDS